MQSYRLTISNSHYLVTVNNKTLLIDTGSPYCYLKNEAYLTLEGRRYPSSPAVAASVENPEVVKMTGMSFDGVIGLNAIMDLGLSINKKTMTVSFTKSQEGYKHSWDMKYDSFSHLLFLPDMEMTSGNFHIKGNLVFDTGAPIHYLVYDFTTNKAKASEAKDYIAMTHEWVNVSTYSFTITKDSMSISTAFAKSPSMLLNMTLPVLGYTGIIGSSFMESFSINPDTGKIYFNICE